MRKVLIFAATAAVVLTSCSSPKERAVTVSNVDISGTIKDFIKVVDGMYTFTNNGEEAFITVKFELTQEPYMQLCIIPWEPYHKYPKFRINAIDINGSILSTGIYGFESEDTELKKIEALLMGKVGDKKSISFKWIYYGVSKEDGIPIFKNATSFEVIEDAFVYCDDVAEMVENGMMELPETVSSEETVSSSSKGSSDLDAALDSYEKYIDQYIKLLKKYKNGDMSVLTEYVKMMETAQEYSQNLSNAQGQFSTAQTKRLLDLNNKFSKAMVEIAE